MICRNCGQELGEGVKVCPICKEVQKSVGGHEEKRQVNKSYISQDNTSNERILETERGVQGDMNLEYYREQEENKSYSYTPRSRVTAGLLQIFLGGFGIGRFYLGYTGIAIGQLFTFPIFFLGAIWGFIDGILILCGQVTHDANGVPIQ